MPWRGCCQIPQLRPQFHKPLLVFTCHLEGVDCASDRLETRLLGILTLDSINVLQQFSEYRAMLYSFYHLIRNGATKNSEGQLERRDALVTQAGRGAELPSPSWAQCPPGTSTCQALQKLLKPCCPEMFIELDLQSSSFSRAGWWVELEDPTI